MKKIIKLIKLVSLMLLLFGGYKGITSFLEMENKNKLVHKNIESGLTPEQVIKLYLTYTGHGKYVMAYELMNDKQKRDQTLGDLKEYGELGKAELEKVISVQQKEDVSLVSAAVKYTDKDTQETKYQIEEFILTKDPKNEWRLIDQEHLGKDQVEVLKGLFVKQSNTIKNSQEMQQLISWTEQQNKKIINRTKDETQKGINTVVDSVKNGLNSNAKNIKDSLFSQ